jgi:hypothetical protein
MDCVLIQIKSLDILTFVSTRLILILFEGYLVHIIPYKNIGRQEFLIPTLRAPSTYLTSQL